MNWAVIDYAPEMGDSTFREQNYLGAKLLDDYIESHYHEEARFGPYAILSRKVTSPD